MTWVADLTDYCKRCGEPIRFFRGYQKDVGEICYTCYLEILMGQAEPEKRVVEARTTS
jgi:uncharacterized protein (DUF983 family)